MEEETQTVYIGDSVYLRLSPEDAVLYLDNGVKEKNRIILEPHIAKNLVDRLSIWLRMP